MPSIDAKYGMLLLLKQDKIVEIIKQQYKLLVSHSRKISESFETISGVKQGWLLTPIFFVIVFDDVICDPCLM